MKQRQRCGRARKICRPVLLVVATLSGNDSDHCHILVVAQIASAFTLIILQIQGDVPSKRVKKPWYPK